MRFLKTGIRHDPSSSTVLEFFETAAEDVSYAIFSHTWEEDEVLYLDVVNGTAHQRKGFDKVCSTMRQAAKDGFAYVWIDNCCINKDSSAELSEAVNSMYRWYQRADVCYAYLVDVPSATIEDSFSSSRWFTRGWTLQELLAPQKLLFYCRTWQSLGDRESLKPIIATVTSIDEKFLDGRLPLEAASIAERMSWASTRVTTRPEDVAYSLMGIFSVNMPMLYGEGGKRAFLRLQEEIMKISGDQSLFAWTDPDMHPNERHGLLADSPKAFQRSGKFAAYDSIDERNIFVMTSLGLRIRLHVMHSSDADIYSAALMCPHPHSMGSLLAIHLKKLPDGDNQYTRVHCDDLFPGKEDWASQECYIRQANILSLKPRFIRNEFLQVCARGGSAFPAGVTIRTGYLDDHGSAEVPYPNPTKRPDYESLSDPPVLRLNRGGNSLALALHISRPMKENFTLLLGSLGYSRSAVGLTVLLNPGLKPVNAHDFDPLRIRAEKAIAEIGDEDLLFVSHFQRHTVQGLLWVVDLDIRRDPQLPDPVQLEPTPYQVAFDRFVRVIGTCIGLAT